MAALVFLRPLWAGAVQDRTRAWLLVFVLLLLAYSLPFSVTQVLEWRRGVPDTYLNQHARLAVSSIASVLTGVTLILLLTRRTLLATVVLAVNIALSFWSRTLH